MSSHKQPSAPWVIGVALSVAVLTLVVLIFVSDGNEQQSGAPNSATSAIASPLPATAAPTVVVKKVGKEMRVFKFADFPNDCAVATLLSDASFYPKGGAVTIHPPKGEPWEDRPGVLSERSGSNQPPGVYMICRKDPGAWGVEIWNQWETQP